MRAWLHADSHAPKAGKLFNYSVLAADSSDHALSGTVTTQFVFSGQVVGHESPPTHPLKNGRLNDNVTFPARAIGIPLSLQVVVHTRLGTITLNWSVRVKK
jgi:hypothetical protein